MPDKFRPSYLKLYDSGELDKRAERAEKILKECVLCPHQCGVDRTSGVKGRCRSLVNPLVSSHNLHFGEEPPISGSGGSGTIFFTNCTLQCKFCQNYPISQLGNGVEYTIEQLAGMYLNLQSRGAHNINFVTPTHFVPQIILALKKAIEQGFSLPFVYNTSGYERIETLLLLEDIIDIYLPDIKYADNNMAMKYSGVSDYVEYNRPALKEMFRQVGFLKTDENGIGERGLIVRHLVLPDNISGSEDCINFLAKELSPHLHLAFMSQFFPAYKAPDLPEISARIKPLYYKALAAKVRRLGFDGWIQPI